MGTIEQEMKELEEAFHYGGFISFFLAIFIGCFLNKLCPRFKWDQSPPGPAEFLGIGNLHQVSRGNSTLEKIQYWRHIYGDVVALSLSQYKMVILSGYETIRMACNTPQFSKRLLVKPFHHGFLVSPGSSLASLSGHLSVMPNDIDILRRLRNFSKENVTESVIVHQNIMELKSILRKLEGQAFVPHKILNESVVKSIYSVVSGKMVNGDDVNFLNLLESVQNIILSASVSSGPNFFMATFFPNIFNSIKKIKSVVLGNCQENLDPSPNESQEVKDTIMDAYFMDIGQLEKISEHQLLKESKDCQSVDDALNLLAATSESVSNTVIWALYYLIRHPQIQEQLYEEIYSHLGKSRVPSLEDISSFPLAQAIIQEVFRITSPTPLGYFHHASEDIMFQGHFIPKDTLVCSNIYALHNDKKIWGDPESFRPQRFLLPGSSPSSSSSKLRQNPDAGPVIPFSISGTSLAETLTRNCTFLYLTTLIQKFQFSRSSNDKFFGRIQLCSELMRAPKEFGIVARERR